MCCSRQGKAKTVRNCLVTALYGSGFKVHDKMFARWKSVLVWEMLEQFAEEEHRMGQLQRADEEEES